MDEALTLKLQTCRDCPRFKTRTVQEWRMGANGRMYEYTCTKVGRIITRDDGIKPPPEWCPWRDGKEQSDE